MSGEATPRPWRIGGGKMAMHHENHILRGPSGEYIARVNIGPSAEANAKLIVRAVNSHDELKEALGRARELLDCWNRFIQRGGDCTPGNPCPCCLVTVDIDTLLRGKTEGER